MLTIRDSPSAMLTAIHAPFMPISSGKNMSPAAKNPKVLKKDMVADIFPLEKAVNRAEANMFTPDNRKHMLYRKNPSMASS